MSTIFKALVVITAALLLLGTVFIVSRRASDDARTFIFNDPETAPANTTCPSGDEPYVKGQKAYELISYPVETLNYRVSFLPGKSGYLAITHTGKKTIEVYVRPCQGVDEVASVLAHEFGHAIDDRFNTDEDRAQIQRLRGYSPQPWFGCNRCTDYATPAGDFAEAFAFMHGPPGRFKSKLNGPPAVGDQQNSLEVFFR